MLTANSDRLAEVRKRLAKLSGSGDTRVGGTGSGDRFGGHHTQFGVGFGVRGTPYSIRGWVRGSGDTILNSGGFGGHQDSGDTILNSGA
jgi:hypothetical protein